MGISHKPPLPGHLACRSGKRRCPPVHPACPPDRRRQRRTTTHRRSTPHAHTHAHPACPSDSGPACGVRRITRTKTSRSSLFVHTHRLNTGRYLCEATSRSRHTTTQRQYRTRNNKGAKYTHTGRRKHQNNQCVLRAASAIQSPMRIAAQRAHRQLKATLRRRDIYS